MTYNHNYLINGIGKTRTAVEKGKTFLLRKPHITTIDNSVFEIEITKTKDSINCKEEMIILKTKIIKSASKGFDNFLYLGVIKSIK